MHSNPEQVELGPATLLEMIEQLKADFENIPNQPFCFTLTADDVYRNAEGYFSRILEAANT